MTVNFTKDLPATLIQESSEPYLYHDINGLAVTGRVRGSSLHSDRQCGSPEFRKYPIPTQTHRTTTRQKKREQVYG